MQELIVHLNESIVLEPGEALGAEEMSLRLLCKQMNLPGHTFDNAETMQWETLKKATGNQTAIYRRGDETRLVSIVPESPNADSFGFAEGSRLTTTSRVFKIGKTDLLGWLPKDGDTLTYRDPRTNHETTYTFRKTPASDTLFQDIGVHGVMMRIFVMDYRGQ